MCHSLGFSLFSYPGGSPMRNGLRGHQTEGSLASRTRSGCSWRTVGMGTPLSGHVLQTSCPPSRQLPVAGYHRPRKQFRILVSIAQSPSKGLQQGDQPTWSWLISLIVQPVPSLPSLIPNIFTSRCGPARARRCAYCLLHCLWPYIFPKRSLAVFNLPDSPSHVSKYKRLM